MVIQFNNVEIPSFVRVTGISFPVLSNIDVRETVIPRRVGNIDNGIKRGGKAIALDVLIEPSKTKTIQEQADELKAWLMGDNWKVSKLILGDQPNKYYLARVANSVEVNDLFTHGEGSIEFYASDPSKYHITETTVNSVNGVATINYAGMEKAPAIINIQITKNCSNIRIFDNKGNLISLIGNFTVGQTVNIDCNTKRVGINGSVSMNLLSFDSDWLYLEKGSNTFSFATNTPSTINNFQIKYRQKD